MYVNNELKQTKSPELLLIIQLEKTENVPYVNEIDKNYKNYHFFCNFMIDGDKQECRSEWKLLLTKLK